MDNLAKQQHKSCELDLVSLQHIHNLDRLGFKIIPLKQDSQTPNIHSTNDIYNNPEYWSETKLQSSHHLFSNVATLLGKSHIKDIDGSDLYLNAIDIDSEDVSIRLTKHSIHGKEVNLLDELLQLTYVTKTRKSFGYHIYWFSHNPNNPVRTTDCKHGSEFEIKTDGGGHMTLPKSRHRKDPSFHYENIGQNKIAIRDDLYDQLIDILSDFLRTKSPKYRELKVKLRTDESNGDEVNHIDYSKIASLTAYAYLKGSRNAIIYDLSSFLCRQNLKLEIAETIVKHLCNLTNDEEVSNRLQVVQNTYEKAMHGKLITGSNALSETLERIVGIEAAEQIIENIMIILNKSQNPVLSQLNQNIRHELSGQIFETICYYPLTLIVAHAVKKQILTCSTPRYTRRDELENNKLEVLRHGEVIINATPVKIVRYENPLNNQIKYQIDFVSPIGQSFIISPSTVEDIIKELRMRGVVYKPRVAEEALNAVLNGAQHFNKVSIVRQIDTPGFYYVNGKIVASELGIYPKELSSEDIRICAEFLTELVTRSKHPEILVTELKWGMLSPFSYVFKQLSQDSIERWMPWLYLDGHTQTSKTTDGTIALAIYRKQRTKVGLGSVDNIRRLGEAISHNTFPVLIDEVKLNPKIQAELIEAMKHSVQGETARTRLTIASKPIHIPALSPCILTSNHSLPADPALRRRFLNFHYPKEDKPTVDEMVAFQSFLKPGWKLLGILGDFTINFLIQNQEIIIDDKNDWRAIAKIVLAEFHKAASLDLPDWIDMISDGNPFEDAIDEEEEIIRGFFKKKINDTFSKNYKSVVPWEDQKDDSSINKNKTMESRLNFCLDNQLISFIRRKNTNSSEILITKDILKELRDADISSIQHFTDLARLMGTEFKPTKIDRKPVRAINVPVAKLINFMDPSE